MRSKKPWNLLWGTCLLALASSREIAAQEVIASWPRAGVCFGYRRSTPDLDGDGFRDLLSGSAFTDAPGIRDAGVVCVVSGRTGTTIFQHFGPSEDFNLGDKVAPLGDTNGDGVPDYAASAYRGGRTFIYSGADGKVLFEHPFRADTIVSLGDIDQDGYCDFLLAVTFTSFQTRVWIYRGGSFEAKFLLPAPPGGWDGQLSNFGVDAAPLGDVDGDGIGDFVIGEDFPTRKGQFPGRAHVFSGASGQILYSIQRGAHFGVSVEALGDLNGNGICDFAVGTEFGVIEFFEGSDGTSLGTVEQPAGYLELGSSLVFAGDVNGNGCNDLLCYIQKYVGPGLPYLERLWLIDGSTHELLLDTDSFRARVLEGGIDWNGDDSPDFLRQTEQTVELVSLAPPWVRAIGAPCGVLRGESPRILAEGQPVVGGAVDIRLTGVTAARDAFLLVSSLSVSRAPVSSAGARGCGALFSPASILTTRTANTGCGAAGASLAISIPDDPALSGRHFLTQWLISTGGRASNPVSATRALQIEIE